MSLFDLQEDPGEQHDVAAKHPEIITRLKGRYDRVVEDMRAGAR
jgi:hypothetical protein